MKNMNRHKERLVCGNKSRNAPRMPLIAPDAPTAGIVSAVYPPMGMKDVWNRIAARPDKKYKATYLP
jgi:hypothetical protein